MRATTAQKMHSSHTNDAHLALTKTKISLNFQCDLWLLLDYVVPALVSVVRSQPRRGVPRTRLTRPNVLI